MVTSISAQQKKMVMNELNSVLVFKMEHLKSVVNVVHTSIYVQFWWIGMRVYGHY